MSSVAGLRRQTGAARLARVTARGMRGRRGARAGAAAGAGAGAGAGADIIATPAAAATVHREVHTLSRAVLAASPSSRLGARSISGGSSTRPAYDSCSEFGGMDDASTVASRVAAHHTTDTDGTSGLAALSPADRTSLLFHAARDGNHVLATACLQTQLLPLTWRNPHEGAATLLHAAAHGGSITIVKALLAHAGAPAAATLRTSLDHNGWTPLQTAVGRGNCACAALLAESPKKSPALPAPSVTRRRPRARHTQLAKLRPGMGEKQRSDRAAQVRADTALLHRTPTLDLASPWLQSAIVSATPRSAAAPLSPCSAVSPLPGRDAHPVRMSSPVGFMAMPAPLPPVPSLGASAPRETGRKPATPLQAVVAGDMHALASTLTPASWSAMPDTDRIQLWRLACVHPSPTCFKALLHSHHLLRPASGDTMHVEQSPAQPPSGDEPPPMLDSFLYWQLVRDTALAGRADALRMLQDRADRWGYTRETTGARRHTALHSACVFGSRQCVSLLLDWPGCNVNAQTTTAETPLHVAARHGHADILTLLLAHGGDLDAPDADNRTPLHLAALSHSPNAPEAVAKLLAAGAQGDAVTAHKQTALHVAATHNAAVAFLLLARMASDGGRRRRRRCSADTIASGDDVPFADVGDGGAVADATAQQGDGEKDPATSRREALRRCLSMRDAHGRTALHCAAASPSTQLVQQLLKLRCDADAATHDGQRPLHIAVLHGRRRTVELLLKHGVDPCLGDANGDAPLHWAAFKGSLGCVKALVGEADSDGAATVAIADPRQTADVNQRNADGGCPLHSAANNGDVEIGELLLSRGGDANAQMDDGNAPLHNACFEGHAQFVEMLLEHGAVLDVANADDRAPLHEAASNGHTAVVLALLERGCDIGAKDRGGDTALHWAACGHTSTVAALLDHGADIDARNVDGGSPLHAAVINGQAECVKLLIARGAEVNARLQASAAAVEEHHHRDTCLHVAAADGRQACVRLLLDAGCNVDATNRLGRTPLHAAIRHGHTSVALDLLRHGARIGLVDVDGHSPLFYALPDGTGRRRGRSLAARPASAAPPVAPEWGGFASFAVERRFADVRLVSQDGSSVPAHRIVLAARCEPLYAMLTSGMREETAARIELPFRTPVLHGLLRFLYSGTVSWDGGDGATTGLEGQDMVDLLRAADQYQLAALKSLCGSLLKDVLDADNLRCMYDIAVLHHAQTLKLACFDYLLSDVAAHDLARVAKAHASPRWLFDALEPLLREALTQLPTAL